MTKFIPIIHVLDDLGTYAHAGVTTAQEIYSVPNLKPLWNDLFLYEPHLVKANEQAGAQILQDDELLRAVQGRRDDARLMLWCALLIAETRWERIVREYLTTAEGRFDRTKISRTLVPEWFAAIDEPNTDDKPTTNLLSYLTECGLIYPQKKGSSIIGVEEFLPTSHAVPGLVRMLGERAQYWHNYFKPVDGDARVDFALSLGANHWLGLTRQEFRRAAHPIDVRSREERTNVPPKLAQLDEQLRKKGQVVLQGPPGTGKTHLAKQYVGWATNARMDESRLQCILDTLPTHERTPARVADEVQRAGLSGVWDIVQFHPSYEYNDFVRSLIAEPVAGGVTFTPRHGLLSFIAALGVELESRGVEVDLILILDELNRGNIPSIFGELLYGLEYRGEPVSTPYAIDGNRAITVPKSLLVVGTMNTADRSIAVIDYALRRRFVFLDVPSDDTAIRGHDGFRSAVDRAAALSLYSDVRDLLKNASTGIQVGPSYFLPSATATDAEDSVRILASGFVYEVLPLLAEYAFESEIDDAAFLTFKTSHGITENASQSEAAAALTEVLLATFGEDEAAPEAEAVDEA